MTTDCETVVIGAGAIGLAIARALSARGDEVTVLERAARAGTGITARSSEVIHAGLYYPPGSLKAGLCVAGRTALYRFAEQNGVPFRRVGKLVVAADEDEVPALHALAARAVTNGAGEIRLLGAVEARTLEPELCCAAALFSPMTGIIDSQAYVTALEGHVGAAGGTVLYGTTVTSLSRRPSGAFVIVAERSGTMASLTAKRLVMAAGLGASQLGRTLHDGPDYQVPPTYLAKGHYFALSGAAPFTHLVYPLPSAGGLGVHLTLDLAGRARFGPDIEWVGAEDYRFEDEGGARRSAFVAAIARYWPQVVNADLSPAGTGIRPKLSAMGAPPCDFAIHGPEDHGYEHLAALYGIESPGLTASLAIADHVAMLLPR